MDPREGKDLYELLDIPRDGADRGSGRASQPRAVAARAVSRPEPPGGGLSFEVVLPVAQARRVAAEIEAACRRDRLGLSLERRWGGSYGSLSVTVTGPSARVNALRSSLSRMIGR